MKGFFFAFLVEWVFFACLMIQGLVKRKRGKWKQDLARPLASLPIPSSGGISAVPDLWVTHPQKWVARAFGHAMKKDPL